MSQAPRYIDAAAVLDVLTWPMVVQAVTEALKALSATRQLDLSNLNAPFVCQPQRTVTKCGQQQEDLLYTMPGFVANYHPTDATGDESTKRVSTIACKLVTSFRGNEQREPPLPSILGNILMFSGATGQLECIMDATQITAWRTAAASIVATKVLYFRRRHLDFQTQPIQVAIIGCGVQGESHALGMCATFQVTDIYLWNRTGGRAEALAERLRLAAPQTRVHVAVSGNVAVAQADVVCVGTYSVKAVFARKALSKPHVHINAVGVGSKVHFGELGQDIYNEAYVYVDCCKSASRELRGIKTHSLMGELGSLLRRDRFARDPLADGLTVFQSMGIAVEDATVAQAVYDALPTAENELKGAAL